MIYGLEVAVIGVVVVFAFLTTLVVSVQLLGWFFRTYGRLPPASPPPQAGHSAGMVGPSTAEIAAIVGAIEALRGTGRER
jgi:Na+-transporting methylmalonyl-CoA/oxaloacetate decarboxylase gamma subunit